MSDRRKERDYDCLTDEFPFNVARKKTVGVAEYCSIVKYCSC